MGNVNKQIGWSQEASLLQGVSQQLSRLLGIVANVGGGGTLPSGALKTLNDLPLSSSLVIISDATNVSSVLRLSTKSVTNYGGGNVTSNTAFGADALTSNTSGLSNTAIGGQAMLSNVAGNYNTAVGSAALRSFNAPGNTFSTAFGAFALYGQTSGAYNTAFGCQAMQGGVDGVRNTAIGAGCGYALTSGDDNTGIGWTALGGISTGMTGERNIAVGFQAGRDLTTGNYNVLIENTTSTGITSGSYNIVINGVNRPGISTGSNNVIIGGFAGTIPNGSDRIFIGTGNGVSRLEFDATGRMRIVANPSQGVGAAIERLLVRDSSTGTVLAVDYAVANATVAALSLATLNATYTTATLGFRVICMDIAGGALIYTKTAGGWCSAAVTNVV